MKCGRQTGVRERVKPVLSTCTHIVELFWFVGKSRVENYVDGIHILFPVFTRHTRNTSKVYLGILTEVDAYQYTTYLAVGRIEDPKHV